MPDQTNQAPTVNAAFGTTIPPMTSSRALGIQRAAYDANPGRGATLKETMQQTLDDPDYPKAVEGAGVPALFIDPGDQEHAMATAADTRELATKYRTF